MHFLNCFQQSANLAVAFHWYCIKENTHTHTNLEKHTHELNYCVVKLLMYLSSFSSVNVNLSSVDDRK